MHRYRNVVATRVSRFSAIAGIAGFVACTQMVPKGPDLSGPAPCGTITCGSGELCFDYERDGSDGSAHPIDMYTCAPPPANCPIHACSGTTGSDACPACLVNGCSPVLGYDGARDVICYGF
jgi:hypothetical protein